MNNKIYRIEDVFLKGNSLFVDNDIKTPYESISNLIDKLGITVKKEHDLPYKSIMIIDKENNIKNITISLDYQEPFIDKNDSRVDAILYELALYLLQDNKDNYSHKTLFSNTKDKKVVMLCDYIKSAKDNELYLPEKEKQLIKINNTME